jgi:hypothetical protein
MVWVYKFMNWKIGKLENWKIKLSGFVETRFIACQNLSESAFTGFKDSKDYLKSRKS